MKIRKAGNGLLKMKRCRLRLKGRQRHQNRMRMRSRRSLVMIATGREIRNQNWVREVPVVLLTAVRKILGWKQ